MADRLGRFGAPAGHVALRRRGGDHCRELVRADG
jgi:hypothetical protein